MFEGLLNKEGGTMVQAIRNNIQSAGQNASGQTSQSLKSEVTDNNDFTRLTISAARHFFVLEEGRRPGKMPPVSVIQKWIDSKPISDATKGLAWAISKKIAKSGSKLFRDGGREDIFSNVITEQRIKVIEYNLAEISAKQTADSIIQTYNKR